MVARGGTLSRSAACGHAMPACYNENLADYPLYVEGYDHGIADADRSHRHDVPIGILIGAVATCVAIYFAPWVFRHFFGS